MSPKIIHKTSHISLLWGEVEFKPRISLVISNILQRIHSLLHANFQYFSGKIAILNNLYLRERILSSSLNIITDITSVQKPDTHTDTTYTQTYKERHKHTHAHTTKHRERDTHREKHTDTDIHMHTLRHTHIYTHAHVVNPNGLL